MKKYILLLIIIVWQMPVINNNAAGSFLLKDHNINITELKALASEYLTKHLPEAKDVSFGGFMDRNSILFPDTVNSGRYVGLQYFLCATTDVIDTNKLSEIYIAYRCVNNYDKEHPDFSVDTDGSYYKSNGSYKYNGKSNTPKDAGDFLINYSDTRSEMNNETEGTQVEADRIHFQAHFQNDNVIAGGFFVRAEVSELLNQTTDEKGLRLIFGFDATIGNKIRILLVGVDRNGKNMIMNGNDYYIMVERSWPPGSN